MSRTRLSLLSASILLAACSGGDDPFGNNDPITQAFDITSTNGLLATKIAWESAIASGDLTDLGGSIGLTAAAPGGLSKASLAQPTGLVMNVMQKVPFGPDEFDCFPSGTFSISGDVENPLTLTANDTFTVLYTMCDDGTGEIVDGQIDFTVGDFQVVTCKAVCTCLPWTQSSLTCRLLQDQDTLTHNGDAALTLDTTDAPFIDAGTSGTSMTTDSNASSETIMNYQSSQTVDGNSAKSALYVVCLRNDRHHATLGHRPLLDAASVQRGRCMIFRRRVCCLWKEQTPRRDSRQLTTSTSCSSSTSTAMVLSIRLSRQPGPA